LTHRREHVCFASAQVRNPIWPVAVGKPGELAEFPRAAREALRQPLEDGEVTIVRAGASVRFPARFALNAAVNPCPCGYLGDDQRPCHCGTEELRRYARRLSGPLLDRIDLYVHVDRVSAEALADTAPGEASAEVRERVHAARALQRLRNTTVPGAGSSAENARIPVSGLPELCQLTAPARRTLMAAVDRLGLTARAYHRALRVGRTIADLESSDRVDDVHVREALGLRHLPATPDAEPGAA